MSHEDSEVFDNSTAGHESPNAQASTTHRKHSACLRKQKTTWGAAGGKGSRSASVHVSANWDRALGITQLAASIRKVPCALVDSFVITADVG